MSNYSKNLLRGSVKTGMWREMVKVQVSGANLTAMNNILNPLRELNSEKNNEVWDKLSGITAKDLGYANLHIKT